jgi:hypothetical protein
VTDDPFRDDHEAALARADALTRENEELRAENARLKQPKQRKQPKPSKQSEPVERRRRSSRGRWLLVRSPIVAVLIAGFAVPCTYERCEQQRYDKAHAAREHRRERWQLATELRPCLREVENRERAVPEPDARAVDARDPGALDRVDGLVVRCEEMPVIGAAWRQAHDEVAAAVKRLDDYYRGGDGRDDNDRSAPALWAALEAAREHRRNALEIARRDLVPAARQIDLEVAPTLEGSTRVRLELRMKLDDAIDALYDARRAGKDLAAQRQALAEGAKAIVARIADAPVEVKREVRGSALMGLADGQVGDPFEDLRALENMPWTRVPEATVIGPAPEAPRGCGDRY